MEARLGSLPSFPPMYERPRIKALLASGLSYSLVTVVSPVGYAKGHAVAGFARDLDARVVWLECQTLSNIPARFWDQLTEALRHELPDLAQSLKALRFPETLNATYTVLQLLSDAFIHGEPVVMVLAHYQHIRQPVLRGFVDCIIGAGLENFSLYCLSSLRADAYLGNDVEGLHVHRVDALALRYTPEEIQGHAAFMGQACGHRRAQEIMDATDGWPMAVQMVLTWALQSPHDTTRDAVINEATISLYLHRHYYNAYDPALRGLLVRLSLLPRFTPDIARRIGGYPVIQAFEDLYDNMFIYMDREANHYAFQSIYQGFLRRFAVDLPLGEVSRVYLAAGESFQGEQNMHLAVACYAMGGHHERVISALYDYPMLSAQKSYAPFFLAHLDKLPAPFVQAHPEVALWKGNFHMLTGQTDEAMAILSALRDKMEAEAIREDQRWILGEAYLSLVDLVMFHDAALLQTYIRKARAYLGGKSRYRASSYAMVGNRDFFFLPHFGPGALEEIMRTYTGATGAGAAFYGDTDAVGLLFQAEAAFYTHALPQAMTLCYRAIYAATDAGLHDIVLNAHFYQMRIAILQGNYEGVMKAYHLCEAYIRDNSVANLTPLRDVIRFWLSDKMRALDQAPRWIAMEHPPAYAQLPLSTGRDMVMRAMYQVECRHYIKAIAMLANAEPFLIKQNAWCERICLYIYRAAACKKTGDTKGALADFASAYAMTAANGVITPFVEAGKHTRALIAMVRKEAPGQYDARWLDQVEAKASTFVKYTSRLSKHYHEKHSPRPRDVSLSPREKQVLDMMAQGLTREESATVLGISVSSVRRAVASLYNKLGAFNRAEAIFVAASKNLITEAEAGEP